MSAPRPRFGIVYSLESRPPVLETFFIALQHTLAMFVGIITPPLIVAAGLGLPADETAFFVSAALFASGISTITQVMRVGPVGTGLLSVQGTSFTFVGPALAAGAVGGIPLMLGMSILAAPLEIILSFVLGFARRLFAPIVTGTSVMMIGFGRTMLILAVACGLGLGVQTVPEALAQLPEAWHLILGSPLIVGTMTAIILNLVFPPESEEGEPLYNS